MVENKRSRLPIKPSYRKVVELTLGWGSVCQRHFSDPIHNSTSSPALPEKEIPQVNALLITVGSENGAPTLSLESGNEKGKELSIYLTFQYELHFKVTRTP